VTLGCHQGALFQTRRGSSNKYVLASNLSFRRIFDWLSSVGTCLDVSPLGYHQAHLFNVKLFSVLKITCIM
jgi:hypothetical protein